MTHRKVIERQSKALSPHYTPSLQILGMKYYFEPWMFRLGTESICDSDENLVISDEDQRGMTEAYPKNSAQADKALREHTSILQSVMNSSMKLGPESVEHYRKQMNESVVR